MDDRRAGVLCGQRGQYRHTPGAIPVDTLNIGLDTSCTGRIMRGKREYDRRVRVKGFHCNLFYMVNNHAEKK